MLAQRKTSSRGPDIRITQSLSSLNEYLSIHEALLKFQQTLEVDKRVNNLVLLQF